LTKLREAIGRIGMVRHNLTKIAKACDDSLDPIPHALKFAM
jgi:hypothetical protein